MKGIKLLIALLGIHVVTLWGMPPPCALGKEKERFGYKSIVREAQELAKKPYQGPAGQVPEFLLKMNYDDWRDIRFIPDKSLWREENLSFIVQFFHPGLYYDRTVAIYVVDASGINQVPFSPDLFNYGKNDFKNRIQPDLGFAGIRLHYPLNNKDYHDEVAVFLGATYFRAVGKKQNYGMSARGIAINTALPPGEEFPYFKKVWLLRPSKDAKKMTVYALVDGPSLTGAYAYTIKPGDETVLDVKSTLFLRKKVDKLGIAPLTSMFFYGENFSKKPVDDFRPEVHDSDGLMIANRTGEWIWRPLSNSPHLLITSFHSPDPVGFGLIQRDTNFDHYQDLETHYESRPSVFVAPIGKWGEGRVELIQIPTENEMNDNIIAMWVPSSLPDRGQPISFSYAMSWYCAASLIRPPGGRVTATRIAKGTGEKTKKFVIDFEGERIQSIPPDKPLTAVITVDPRVKLIEQQLYKNRVTKGWRLVFQIDIQEPGPMERVLPAHKRSALELRAFLKMGESALTETWSYAFRP